LAGITINLEVKAKSFESQVDIIQAKGVVNINNTRKYGDAIQHLYESLNIEIRSNLVANFVSNPNASDSKNISYEYDESGKLLAQNIDKNNDGTIDSIKSYQYDSNNNITNIADTASNISESMVYDDQNNLLSRQVDNPDDQHDLLELYVYENNKLKRLDRDQEADGTIESTTTYNYDSQGNLTKYEIDQNGDGETDRYAIYTYENGKVTSYIEDNNNDGIPDMIVTYAYNNQGQRISHNVQLAKNNAPNALSNFEYNDNNSVTRFEQDKDLDGTPDYIESYQYDHNNNLTRNRRDVDADGAWDFIAAYTYDENGNRIGMVEDTNADGLADKVWNGEYQAANIDNTWDSILGTL
jgi:serralysin